MAPRKSRIRYILPQKYVFKETYRPLFKKLQKTKKLLQQAFQKRVKTFLIR